MKSKNVFVIAVLLISVIYELCTGVYPIFSKLNPVPLENVLHSEKGTYIEGVTHYSSDECYTITHLMGGLIPTGYEHFFLIYNEDFTEGVIFRADSDWADNFDCNGFNADGIKISGVLKRMDFEMENEIYSDLISSEADIAISAYYIDGLSDRYAVLTIICTVIFAILIPLLCFSTKKFFQNGVFRKILLLVLAANIFFHLHIFIMVSP